MGKLMRRVLNVRPEERSVVALMALYYLLTLIVLYLLKPVRDSLFLADVGANQLPLVFILIAILGVPVTSGYARLSRKLNLFRTMLSVTLISCAVLVLLRWMLTVVPDYAGYLLYLYVSMFGILSVSQFWLLANAVFSSTQAKRLFSVLGLAGIVGAVIGGAATSVLISELSIATEDLMFVSIGLLLLSLVILDQLRRRSPELDRGVSRSERAGQSQTAGSLYRLVQKHPYLLTIIGIIASATIASSLVDFQFKSIAAAEILDKDGLTSFLGRFYGIVSVCSIVFQLGLTNRLIRKIGVAASTSLLPLLMFSGFTGLLVFPGLTLATLVRGGEASLSYSTDKTARELLFLPVPLELKRRVKVFIDLFVDRGAQGIAGALLLVATFFVDYATMIVTILGMLTAVVWIILARSARKDYLNAFRDALARRQINPDEVRIDLTDRQVLDSLEQALQSDNERELNYALDLIADSGNKRFVEPVRELVDFPTTSVQARAMRALCALGLPIERREAEQRLDHPDLVIATAAVRSLVVLDKDFDLARLLNDVERPGHVLAAATHLADEAQANHRDLLTEVVVRNLIALPEPHTRKGHLTAARLTRYLPDHLLAEVIPRILEGADPEVLREIILSTTEARIEEAIPGLIELLGDRALRADAARGLARFGDLIIAPIVELTQDPKELILVREYAPRVLSNLATQKAVDALTGLLNCSDPRIQYAVVRALGRIRSRGVSVKVSRAAISTSLAREARVYIEIQQVLSHNAESSSEDAKLLRRALSEKLDHHLERIFRLLGLRYSLSDILTAYRNYTGNDRKLRADAVEFLDSMLSTDERNLLFPILEHESAQALIARAREQFGIHLRSCEEALDMLLQGDDPWLKSCAILRVVRGEFVALFPQVQQLKTDPDQLVAETAALLKSDPTTGRND